VIFRSCEKNRIQHSGQALTQQTDLNKETLVYSKYFITIHSFQEIYDTIST